MDGPVSLGRDTERMKGRVSSGQSGTFFSSLIAKALKSRPRQASGMRHAREPFPIPLTLRHSFQRSDLIVSPSSTML